MWTILHVIFAAYCLAFVASKLRTLGTLGGSALRQSSAQASPQLFRSAISNLHATSSKRERKHHGALNIGPRDICLRSSIRASVAHTRLLPFRPHSPALPRHKLQTCRPRARSLLDTSTQCSPRRRSQRIKLDPRKPAKQRCEWR